MKRTPILALLALALVLGACKKDEAHDLPTFSNITVSPSKSVYALGDQVQCSITMLSPGDASLKKATWWFYASWWGSDPDMTADFCTPETIEEKTTFTSRKITLNKQGTVRLYFWGRLEYPNWDFQPIQIPVTLHVE